MIYAQSTSTKSLVWWPPWLPGRGQEILKQKRRHGVHALGAVRLVFGAKLRRRWPSWLAIVILISVVGGFVLAAVAAGRRTESAFPRFVAAHGFDADVYAIRPLPELARLPEVVSAAELYGPDNSGPTCECTHPINPTDFGVIVASPRGRTLFKLISGHLPDPSALDQALASFTLQQDYGVHLGSIIHVPFYSASQASAFNNANPAVPNGGGGGANVFVLPVQYPAEIENYRSIGATPLLLAAGLAIGAVVALGLTLAASVRRRRRDLALLETLGFTQRQLATCVGWQSTIAVVIGLIAGIPLGIALGRWLWILFAQRDLLPCRGPPCQRC